MIHKINSSVDYNKWLKRLSTQLNEPTNQNSIKVTKVVQPSNKNQSNTQSLIFNTNIKQDDISNGYLLFQEGEIQIDSQNDCKKLKYRNIKSGRKSNNQVRNIKYF